MTNYEIRTTELEEFVWCPYLYANKEPKVETEWSATALWTKMHRSVQSYLSGNFNHEHKLWERNIRWTKFLEAELNPEEQKYINNCINLADKYNLPNFLVTEVEYKSKFVVWEDTVTVTWHIDWIPDYDYLVDIKSAKQKRQEKSLLSKFQRKTYPVLYALSRYPIEKLNEVNIKFDYWIFTKQVTPQFQWLRLMVNAWEYYWEVMKAVKDYVLAKKNWVFTTNTTSSNCYRCPLKKSWKCPAYSISSQPSGTREEICAWI